MINIGLHKKLVTSFDQSGTDQQEINNDVAHDGGIYIFDIDCLSDKSAAVTSSSDNCLSIYDTETLSQIRKIRAHTQMLNSFDLSQLVPHLAFSASNDHFCVDQIGYDHSKIHANISQACFCTHISSCSIYHPVS